MNNCEKCGDPCGVQRTVCTTCVLEAEKAAMALPAGKTCGDCHWWRKCSGLIGSLTGKETSCDFHPSRFRERGTALTVSS